MLERVNKFRTIFDRHTDMLWIINEKAFEINTPELDEQFRFLNAMKNRNSSSPLKNTSIFSKNTENNTFSNFAQFEKNLQEPNLRKLVIK